MLNDNDILLYSTHNEGNSVVAERFIKNLKDKIYKKMTRNDSKSYLGYLKKLVDEYNNNYNCSTGKKVYSCWLLYFGWKIWIES